MNSSILFALLILLFAPLITACSPSGVPYERQEEASYATVRWLDEAYGFVSSRELRVMLNRVVNRLDTASVLLANRNPDLSLPPKNNSTERWQVFVLNIEEPNAFSAGGGVIILTRGIFSYLESEAALATVISHEMAHSLYGHTETALSESIQDPSKPQNAPHFSFSTIWELQADALGLEILRAARYDPRHALDAITLAYRYERTPVSDDKDWLAKRIASLTQYLDTLGNYLPATRNTREYSRVRRLLLNVH